MKNKGKVAILLFLFLSSFPFSVFFLSGFSSTLPGKHLSENQTYFSFRSNNLNRKMKKVVTPLFLYYFFTFVSFLCTPLFIGIYFCSLENIWERPNSIFLFLLTHWSQIRNLKAKAELNDKEKICKFEKKYKPDSILLLLHHIQRDNHRMLKN